MNLGVVKQPKAFITLPEIISCIIAFSVLASYRDTVIFQITCPDNGGKPDDANEPDSLFIASHMHERPADTMSNLIAANFIQDALKDEAPNSVTRIAHSDMRRLVNALAKEEPDETTTKLPPNVLQCEVTVQYPFKLNKYADEAQECKKCDKSDGKFILTDTSSSMAIFFMFVAVTSFLFTLVMVPVYIFQDSIASQFPFFNTLDLILHVILLIFWFCASISWAAGIANLKYDTSERQILAYNDGEFNCNADSITCSAIIPSSYGGPVVSVIFGFINLILYGANLWFIFKDESLQS